MERDIQVRGTDRTITGENIMRCIRIRSVALAIPLGLLLSSCYATDQLSLRSSWDVPSAVAEVKTRETFRGNTRVDLRVQHLAKPEDVDPTATVYVVWVRPLNRGALPTNLGKLEVNRHSEGRLSAVTPLHDFEVLITPEPWKTVMVPTGKTILAGRFGADEDSGKLKPQ